MHSHSTNKQRALRRVYWAVLIIAPLLFVLVYMLSTAESTQARPNYSSPAGPDAVATQYPDLSIFSTSCLLCHTVQTGPPTLDCRGSKDDPKNVKDNCKLTDYGEQLSNDSFRNSGGKLNGDPAILLQMEQAIENVKGEDADGDGFSNDEELLVNLNPINNGVHPTIVVELTVEPSTSIEVIKGDNLELKFTIKNSSKENIPLNASLVVAKKSGVEVSECQFTFSEKVEQEGNGVDRSCRLTVEDDMTLTTEAKLTADQGATTLPDSKNIEIKVITPDVAVRPEDVDVPVARGEPFELSASVENRTGRDLPKVQITVEHDGEPPQTCTDITNLSAGASANVACPEVTANSTGAQTYTIIASVNGNRVNAGEIVVDVWEREPAVTLTTAPERIMAPIGTEAVFDVQVTNGGNVALFDITLDNQRIPACNQTVGDLAVDEQAKIVCQVFVTDDMVEIHDSKFVFLSEIIVTGKETHNNSNPLDPQRTIIEVDATRRLMLPVIRSSIQDRSPQVDLIVSALNVVTGTAAVQIQNIGPESLPANSAFWVDLYIDPAAPPTGVNQTADDFNGRGLIWGVRLDRPLAPQGRLDLQVGDRYFDPDRSRVPAVIAAGSPIYVQVDSANASTSYGGVLEMHERNGGFYNNIISNTLTSPISTLAWPGVRAAGSEDNSRNDAILPSRETRNQGLRYFNED